jgi:hypothetical protein
MELEHDSQGNIHTSPVTAWFTGTLAGMGILLAIRYADTPEEIESGGKQVQLSLTALQSLAIAKRLTALATHALQAAGGPAGG